LEASRTQGRGVPAHDSDVQAPGRPPSGEVGPIVGPPALGPREGSAGDQRRGEDGVGDRAGHLGGPTGFGATGETVQFVEGAAQVRPVPHDADILPQQVLDPFERFR